jgi:hypothetical protein
MFLTLQHLDVGIKRNMSYFYKVFRNMVRDGRK